MNGTRRKIVIVASAVIFTMLIFPPFHFAGISVDVNMGYGFLFMPPHYDGYEKYVATVNVPMLFAQWMATLLIACGSWMLGKNDADQKL